MQTMFAKLDLFCFPDNYFLISSFIDADSSLLACRYYELCGRFTDF